MNGKRQDPERLVQLRHGSPEDREALARLAAEDAGAAETLAVWDAQDSALRALYDPVAEEPVPERLRAILDGPPARPWALPPALTRIAAALALVAVGAAGGWFAARVAEPGPATASFAEMALDAYATYAPEVRHPVEVAASDEPHLTQWLSKRLGSPFAPPDLQALGYTLIGGRVVPGDGGTGAMMMYEDAGGRRVTLLLMRKADAPDTAWRYVAGDGAGTYWWFDQGLGCAISGTVPKERLKEIADAVYDQLV